MNRIPFATNLKRVPAFGLGCVGGAAGVARIADYLRAFPEQCAILLSVELCSLTLQRNDLSPANLISMGLFADGAAAVLLVGAEHPSYSKASPRVVDSLSVFFPDTERAMGWDIVDTGFKIVLDPSVPEIARQHLRPAVDSFLAKHGLTRRDIKAWVCHPGGPKIMDAVADGLELSDAALKPARDALGSIGNLSSASVLFLLDEFRNALRPESGSFGIMLAMGPAFCAEIVLLKW
jgi:alkylresorcinol/alkylpyrone synthase